MAKLLTARAVDEIKAPGRHAIGNGLYLEIDGSARRWFFRYQVDGKRREMGLGSAHDISLKEARQKVDDAKRSIRDGVDPIAARRVRRPAIPTFGQFADSLTETLAGGFRNEKHIYQWRQTLGEAYCASIRDKLVTEIATADVLGVLSPIWQIKQETASRLRGRIEKVLDAAKAKGYREGENPARWRGHLVNLLPRRQKLQRGHQPAMPYLDVPAFVGRLKQRDAVAARALEFLILTAARAGEVCGASWTEIDLSQRLWTIPADRMKAGREHRIPLSGRAVTILKGMLIGEAPSSAGAFVFPGGRRERPLSNMAFKQLLVRMGEVGFVPHGFRSSFCDWCGERTSVPRDVAEMALAHVVGDEVERAYRRGDALDKRRVLMDAWAEFCEPAETEKRVGATVAT